jgi:hypothetical protein
MLDPRYHSDSMKLIFLCCFYLLVFSESWSYIIIPGTKELSNLSEHRYMRSRNVMVCTTLSCVQHFSAAHNSSCYVGNNTVIISMLSSNVDKDMLLHLFFPWVYELFSTIRYNIYFLIIETQSILEEAINGSLNDDFIKLQSMNSESLAREVISMLPTCTAFIINHCNSWSDEINPHGLISHRKKLGHPRNVVIHLNHEQPMSSLTEPSHFFDHCYGTPFNILETYNQYSLVIRHFYYEIYGNNERIAFLPLGAKNHVSVRAVRFENGVKIASQRKHLCTFR